MRELTAFEKRCADTVSKDIVSTPLTLTYTCRDCHLSTNDKDWYVKHIVRCKRLYHPLRGEQ